VGGVCSPLLHQLLSTCCSTSVAAAALAALQPLDATAAKANDMLEVFKCKKTFPKVGGRFP
jgi:hypothetical protein